jgi:hypothetical protein
MNALGINTFAERSALREQYLSNLQLKIENEQKNANAQKILKNTGQTPSQLIDSRTGEELFKDMVSLKRDVKNFLVSSSYLSPRNANIFIDGADDATIQFIYQNKTFILKDYLSKSITPLMFEDFIQEYMLKYALNAGVEIGIQQQKGLIISNNQILNRLVSNNELDRIQQLISIFEKDLNISPRGQQVIDTTKMVIDILRQRLPTQKIMQKIDSLSQADQYKSRELLSEFLKEIPTKEQVIKEILILDESIQRQSTDMFFGTLMRINQLLAISKGREEGLEEIVDYIEKEDSYDFESGFDEEDEQEEVQDIESNNLEPTEEANIFYNTEDLITYLTVSKVDNLKLFLRSTKLYRGLQYIDPLKGGYKTKPPIDSIGKLNRIGAKILKNETNWEALAGIYMKERLEIGEAIKDAKFDPVGMTFLDERQSNITDASIEPEMFGRGMVKKSKKDKFKEKINFTDEKPKPYTTFGKFYLNKQRLNDGILMIKGEGSRETGFKTRKITKNLKDIFIALINDKTPDFSNISKLTDEDKENLYEAVKISKYDKISIDAPSKTKDEQLSNEFDVLKGSILSGNNSDKAIKRFKFLLVRLMNSKRIPRGQANEILFELAEMGY